MNLNGYELLAEIGRGAAGVVYRARSPRGELVAVKVLLHAAGDRLARFRREERLQALLREEGFVPLLEVGESPRGPFLVMPLLEGGTLRQRLRLGPLPVGEALGLGRALARIVGRAHAAGIVHRDLKPENVLFAKTGEPYVADLGLAKHFRPDALGASQSRSLTKADEMLGTVGYMAPEQTSDPHGAGPAADVFALGAILYELLAGESPFEGETAVEILARTASGEYVPLRRARPETPPWLAATVERALASSPDERFPDALALARALEGAIDEPLERRWSGLAIALAVAAGGALFLIGVGVALALRPSAPRPAPSRSTSPSPPPAPSPSPSRSPSPRPTPSASPTPSPNRTPAFPDLCRSFLSSEHTRLAGLFGSYAGKHEAMVAELAITADGKKVLSAGLDGFLALWDAETGEALWSSGQEHPLYTASLGWGGTDAILYAGDGEGNVVSFDAARRETHRFAAHPGGQVYSTRPTSDGARLWTAGHDGKMRLWDLATQHSLREIDGGTSLRLLPGERQLLGVSGSSFALYDAETGKKLRSFEGHTKQIYGLAVSADGRRALTCGDDQTARVWDLSGESPPRVLDGHRARLGACAISPDGRIGVTGGFDSVARVWDLETGKELRALTGHAGWVMAAAFTPDGRRLITGSNDQTVRAWDVATGQELWPRSGHASRVTSLAALPDGRGFVSGSYDMTVRTWDAERGELRVLGSEPVWVGGVASSPDGRRALSIGGGRLPEGRSVGVVSLWDASSGARLGQSAGPAGWTKGVAFGPLAGRALTVGEDPTGHAGELVVWSLDDDKLELSSRIALPSPGARIAVSPGRWVAAGLEDGSIALWTAPDLEAQPQLVGPKAPVTALAFSPDGGTLAVGYPNGVLVLWSLAHREKPRVVRAHSASVSAAAFLDEGRRLATSGGDGSIRLFDVEKGEALDRIDLSSSHDHAEALVGLGPGLGFAAGTTRGVILRFELK